MKKILLVDDKSENHYLFESLFNKEEFQIYSVRNGKEALETAISETPDIIVSDVLMPVMDGYTLCMEMKKNKKLQNIPFIFFTATYNDPRDAEYGLKLGADRFLFKPSEPDEVLSAVYEVLKEYRSGKKSQPIQYPSETVILKQYNETLIRKLEDKLFQTEKNEMELAAYAEKLEKEITERAIREKQLKDSEETLIKAKEKAEENDRLKSAFLQNLSHEIRTPMNGILGFTQLLLEKEISPEVKKEYLHLIEKSGERMLKIINDLVEISKIETGQITLFPEKIDVHEIFSELYMFFKMGASEKDLKISTEVKLTEKESLLVCDRGKLVQVMSNLIENAIKFTQSGIIEFGCMKAGNCIEFYVKDTGIGIPLEYQNIIFDRFVQGDDSISRSYEGAGLGLSISKALIEKMGGTIQVKSEPGKGSSFQFKLPHSQKSQTRVNEFQHINTTLQANNVTLLVVEDNYANREYLSSILRYENFKVIEAKDGLDALEILKAKNNVDLVLMDLKMPTLDGFQTIRILRELGNPVPVIAQTALAYPEERAKAMAAGFVDFISKPMKKTELLEKIYRNL